MLESHLFMLKTCIALVQNLQTGYILPQYHVIHDEWFETVHASKKKTSYNKARWPVFLDVSRICSLKLNSLGDTAM